MNQTTINTFNAAPAALVKPAWWVSRHWFKPSFYGLEHLNQQQPALYVGNHTIYGFDSPAFVLGVYQHQGIWLRGLADRFHFYFPLWRDVLTQFGAFEGTRAAVATLMQNQQHILIYPGGSREVLKNKNEAYQLFWKKRLGFVELAIEHGYDIIPFAALGGEETLDIRYDSHDFNQSILGKLAQKTGFSKKFLREGNFFFPIVRGYKHLPFLPKPLPLSYQFMPRIHTHQLGQHCTLQQKIALRAHIKQQIEQGLQALRDKSSNALK